ncbi:glyoxalase [Knoellia sinensis KCTC 19936]|uniref:Glyoxalase n=1 Tax=Knoellia sinensis KCTC 19936 TaxID=1385520 RepID=A0A0A0J8Y9_9MICO|nr:VOC family protein [Knoellia sinensis]KGN32056.1 glyoxalase [Knoellia sinensis KCTC 19936]
MAHGDITHVDIPSGDMERSKAFYSDLFGWEFVEYPGYEGYPMFRSPNEVSGGGLAPRDGSFTQPRSTVEVDSIDDALAKVKAQGGRVTKEKEQISETSWWATFEDPDGNVIALHEGD